MTQLPSSQTENIDNWKTRTYATGVLIGGLLGLASAYLFARAAEENEEGKPDSIPTGTLISLLLAALSLIRQIADSGRKKK